MLFSRPVYGAAADVAEREGDAPATLQGGRGALRGVWGVYTGVTITQNIMAFAAPADQDPVSASNQYDTRGPCL